jgi:vitamin B12 transporter
MKISPSILFSSILLPASLSLSAAESLTDDQSLETLPSIIVTASRQAEATDDTTVATTVFTRKDIESIRPSSLPDLISRAPGIQTGQFGGRGSLASLFVRGTKSAQTLILVDGVRINGADSGAASLEALALDQIERVEIIRGPRSAIYGSDAIGGVIQIFTRSGEPGLQPRLHLGFGSNKSWERSAGISGGDEKTSFNLSLSFEDTNGIDRTTFPTTGPNTDRDAFRNNSVSLGVRHILTDDLDIGFSVLDQRGETEYDFGYQGVYPYDEFQLSTASVYSNLSINDIWDMRFDLGHVENRRFNKNDDNNKEDNFNTYRDSLALVNTISLVEGQRFIVGADGYQEQLNTDEKFSETERWNRAAFVQHKYDADKFSTEVGVRYDKNEMFGSESSWNGALTIPLDRQNDIIFSYGEGFRAPTFVDLYYPGGYANPDLQPERSKSYEVQWRSDITRATQLQASIYQTDITDAIVLDSGFRPNNIGSARIEGAELSLSHRWQDWRADVAVDFTNPEDRNSGKQLVRRAKRTLNVDLARQLGKFSVGGNWQLISRSWDNPDNTREISGYGLLNLRSGWQAADDLVFNLVVDNVFDKEYSRAFYGIFDSAPPFGSNYYPYRENGRTFMASVTWTPKL